MMSPPAENPKQQPQLRQRQVDGLPVFDPTERTMQQVLRDVAASREIIEARIDGIQNNLETRLQEREKAIELLQHAANRIPELVSQDVKHLQLLHEEKFSSIRNLLAEKDARSEESSRESKVAIAAALQAAKEAVLAQNESNTRAIDKSEAEFTKQIAGINFLVGAMGKSIDDKIDDIKSRVQSIESQKKGQGDLWHVWFGVTGVVVAMLSVGVAILTMLFSKSK
jgi:hypothetical protein